MKKSFLYVLLVPVLVGVCGSSLFGQEVQSIAEVDFDKTEPAYDYSFAFAGYGDAQTSESVMVKEQVSATAKRNSTDGFDPKITDLAAKAKALKEKHTSVHPEVVAIVKQIEALQGSNKCGTATLDSTKVKIPSNAMYDYVGWGLGTSFDMGGKTLPSTDWSKFNVSFDAKISGTNTLMGSKFQMAFVVDDDEFKADDNDSDDVVFGLIKGDANGDGCISLTSEFKRFSFSLDKMTKREGSLEAIKTAKLKGVTFTVQAQGDAVDIGNDTDNVLYVDNIRLTYSGE